ncbi:MAG: PIG-L family deacetylase [Actinomycetota bacterium]|nr:PIG-L family deacetylase [Actinomycetota bacterium]
MTIPPPTRTLVFVHAHPDDEALLTAGTMARAVAEGQRVVLIVATNGAAGLSTSGVSSDLAAVRSAELEAAAQAIGIHRLVSLNYADSGLNGEIDSGFAHVDRFTVAKRIAAVLDEEQADVLVGYDPAGGYGHPDHVQVHRSVRAASVLAKKAPTLFEATLPREPIAKAVRLAGRMRLTPKGFDVNSFDSAWTPSSEITHRIDARKYWPAKRTALRAHASQHQADAQIRTLAVLTRLPGAIGTHLLGTEYYCLVSAPKSSTTRSASKGSL